MRRRRSFRYLRELGVTMLEVMPVAECPGRWNWGYDGVQLSRRIARMAITMHSSASSIARTRTASR